MRTIAKVLTISMIRAKQALILTVALMVPFLAAGESMAEDRVLTIYFCATGATDQWYLEGEPAWHKAGGNALNNPTELIASLYQNDDSWPIEKYDIAGIVYKVEATEGGTHYKYIVNGLGSDFFSLLGQIDPDFGIRGWDVAEDEAYLALDLVADEGDNIILNLIGWSRGGILTMKMARRVADDTRVSKINILAYDPVPGGFDPITRHDADLQLPAKVNQFIGIYARDEHSAMFDPMIPDVSELPGTSKVWLAMVPGSHETMAGNCQLDGHSITPIDLFSIFDQSYEPAMLPVNRIATVVAEQLLTSWEWGEVSIWEPSTYNNQADFLQQVSLMHAYDYWFVRGVSFLPGWSGYDGCYNWLGVSKDHNLRIYWPTPVLHGRLCFVAPYRHDEPSWQVDWCNWFGHWYDNHDQVYWLDQKVGPMDRGAWDILQSFCGSPPPDTTPPVPTVDPLPTITGECSVSITAAPTAIDDVVGTVKGTTTDPLTYTVQGTYTITWTYDDGNGNTATQTQTVIVEDTTPPSMENLSANPNILWPPNHKMVPVVIDVNVFDNCDEAPICRITSVSSNEPENSLADGNTTLDWQITANQTVNLRAERSGTGSDRVYTITVECVDAAGNSSTSSVGVTVPHDQGKHKKSKQ